MTWSDPQYQPEQYPQQYHIPMQPPPASAAKPRGRWAYAVGGGAVAAALVIGTVAVANGSSGSILGSGSITGLLPTTPSQGANPGSGNSGSGNSGSGNSGSGNSGSGNSGTGNSGTGNSGSGGTMPGGTSTSIALATDKQKTGIVTIVSVLGYQNAEGAGTGMVLTSNGEILTNNHVVDGATSITVTVVSTGKSYRADVVGTDPTDDVAVVRLRNASGLATAKVGDSADVAVGDSIVGVGNAGGTGVLRASSGSVTALDQTITATDESGQNAERLDGLIGVDAPIISGDSGGPMYDSGGDIIGMNTAASESGQSVTGSASAYAIPIDHALDIASQIESGKETSTIHIGLPGFLGVGVADNNGSGVAITSVLPDGPADKAGIAAGSVITAINGKKTDSAEALKTALSGHANSSVKVTWTDANGETHTATVTLVAGPAD